MESLQNNCVLAAEQYRRANELAERSKEELIAALIRERGVVKLRAVAKVAGVYENTLRKWVKNHG